MISKCSSADKVSLQILDPGFNRSLLLRTVRGAGIDNGVVVIGKLQKILVEVKLVVLVFQDCRLHVVHLEPPGYPAKICKSILKLLYQRLQLLVIGKCIKIESGIGQDNCEAVCFDHGTTWSGEHPHVAKVNLCYFSGRYSLDTKCLNWLGVVLLNIFTEVHVGTHNTIVISENLIYPQIGDLFFFIFIKILFNFGVKSGVYGILDSRLLLNEVTPRQNVGNGVPVTA